MTTRADKKGNRYVLNGRKHWITGGGVSRLHLIFAKVYDEKGAFEGIGGFLAQGVGQPEHGPGPQQQLLADVARLDEGLMTSEQFDAQFLFEGFDGV